MYAHYCSLFLQVYLGNILHYQEHDTMQIKELNINNNFKGYVSEIILVLQFTQSVGIFLFEGVFLIQNFVLRHLPVNRVMCLTKCEKYENKMFDSRSELYMWSFCLFSFSGNVSNKVPKQDLLTNRLF